MEFENVKDKIDYLSFKATIEQNSQAESEELSELKTLLKHSEQRGKLLEMLKELNHDLRQGALPSDFTLNELQQLIKECEDEKENQSNS